MEGNDENQGILDAMWFMIQTKIHQEFGKRDPLAESNREFIVKAFNKLADGQLSYYPEFNECEYVAVKLDGEIPPFYGLYMINERRASGKYPLYVGYTSTRFDFRLNYGHDVINWHCSKKRDGHLEFDFIPTFNQSHAKLLESVFLGAFDFCRNKVENGKKREPKYNSEVLNPEQSKMYFDAVYNLMVQDISRLHDYYKLKF